MGKLLKQAEAETKDLHKLGSLERVVQSRAELKFIRDVSVPLVATLAATGIMGGLGYMASKKDLERSKKEIEDSMHSTIQHNPAFRQKPQKFIERFGELSVVSPTLAKNPSLASKIINKTLDKGFSVDELHKLTAIQASSGHNRQTTPSAAARAGALNAFGKIIDVFGLRMLDHAGRSLAKKDAIVKDLQTNGAGIINPITGKFERTSDIMEQLAMEHGPEDDIYKQGAAGMTSDDREKLAGNLMAERYCMLKEAGLGAMLSGAGTHVGRGLAFMLPAAAIAGGVDMVRSMIEHKRDQRLSEEADKHFKKIMLESSTAQSNPEMAREAFMTMKAVAPSLAARPLVAKTFIENIVNREQIPPDMVSSLADAENKVRGIQGAGGGFAETFKSISGSFGEARKSEISEDKRLREDKNKYNAGRRADWWRY